MSGGKFNDNGYVYYRVHQFADELESAIENNETPDEYGYAPNFSNEVLEYLRSQLPAIKNLAEAMRAIDYLYSGDHGEDSFLRAIERLKSTSDKSAA